MCAYDDAKCARIRLDGSITVRELEQRAASLPKDQEISSTAPTGEASAAGQAARFQAMGFRNAKALKGGVEAWQRAGYPMAA